ncbi:MAG: YibE/F family protein, partial [Gudongella sp.]|nr:YibE/F family protein [Gudongella sp.]
FILLLLPNPFQQDTNTENSLRVKAEIIEVDNQNIHNSGLVKTGDQECYILILEGKLKGKEMTATNILLGKLEMDKIFEVGDQALAVLDVIDETVTGVTLVDHYRIGEEIFLGLIFVLILLVYARGVGLRALFSFVFTILMIWKVLLPAFLLGYNPVVVAFLVAIVITSIIILLVYGFDRRALSAITGALAGTLLTCIMAIIFVQRFKIHGAVMAYAESLLYSGFSHLNLTSIFIASIFIASSGAVMDLSVDITSAVYEVIQTNPNISRKRAIQAGFNVGRDVIGTMTTTLLLAYSGGFMGLMMVFMAQGTPIINILNLKYVASEIIHTLVGSFGLVSVAPLTALTSGIFLKSENVEDRNIKKSI